MELEKQFEAAIRIIEFLPIDGPFQPSEEMSLRLYSYSMQSKFGPYDGKIIQFLLGSNMQERIAWKCLGSMSRSEAMKCYIEEIKLILETMSLNKETAGFLKMCGPFYEFVDEDSTSIQGNESSLSDYSIKNLQIDYFLEDSTEHSVSSTCDESDSSEDENVNSPHNIVVDRRAFLFNAPEESIKPHYGKDREFFDGSSVVQIDQKDPIVNNEEESESFQTKLPEDIQMLRDRLERIEVKIDELLSIVKDFKSQNHNQNMKWNLGTILQPINLFLISCPLLIPFVFSITKKLD
ncbi:uncharacterized protein [Lepeophtheirus salmonis]|nr:acyl-CoA-binding domain-containing protein 5-like isoform X2 [Lepeophtheirus salmonis]XP_040571587.1 acyl-CoA-binding domain-containing protein 5-like isoform X2 [Lepeophtheirus salmonis]XP_040571588.1 acyl-CoA-binding domain-containing protein 5-like isoform X2 [Lepeophtheirus salmonis]XP_040571589.1 acyl-CoA-binding domain-containing protein 5-like isoform X2 [Lepeophtheirus salmonis]XP_040571590.1 acyl-CoA-binding domain-containing protein 5-like isoform X2 [Lepeophtheirus salmonis]XP_04